MDAQIFNPFVKSVSDVMKQMAGLDVNSSGDFYAENEEIVSYGVSSIITFSGKIKGRLLLDMEKQLALKIAQNVNGTSFNSVKEFMVLATISELNNIIAGDGITALNNLYSLGLRLAPPIVFAGNNTVICIPKISPQSVNFNTEFGNLKLDLAFEGGI